MICVFIMSPPKSCSRQKRFFYRYSWAPIVELIIVQNYIQYIHWNYIHIYKYALTSMYLLLYYLHTNTIKYYNWAVLSVHEFRRKTEMNKKDNNSIFITEKRCVLTSFLQFYHHKSGTIIVVSFRVVR